MATKTERFGAAMMQVRTDTADRPIHDLFIYTDISAFGTFDWDTFSFVESETSADHIRDLLAEIPDTDEIHVHINSNGGDASEAVAIASMLRSRKGRTVAVVDGAAHSAAFTIVQGCSERVMYSGTTAFIHNAWADVSGNAAELRAAADALDATMVAVTDMYMERATCTRDELVALFDAGTMLSPEKALELGLIDRIATGTDPVLSADEAPADDSNNNDNNDNNGNHGAGFDALFA